MFKRNEKSNVQTCHQVTVHVPGPFGPVGIKIDEVALPRKGELLVQEEYLPVGGCSITSVSSSNIAELRALYDTCQREYAVSEEGYWGAGQETSTTDSSLGDFC